MKKFLIGATLAAILSFGAYGAQVVAQGPVGAPQQVPGTRMALLDISRIFKDHARFRSMMNDMRSDVQQAEARVGKDREAINKLRETLRGYRPGTTDYKSLDEEITRREAELSIGVEKQRKEFLLREAKIYYYVYQEISQATDYFCRQHGIDMVLRFNSEQVDPEQPQSVLTGINKPVVWYNRNLDITEYILAELNRTAITPGQADRRGAAPQRPTVPFNNNPVTGSNTR